MKTQIATSIIVVLCTSQIAFPETPELADLAIDMDVRHQTFEGWGIVFPCHDFDPWIKSDPADGAAYDRTAGRNRRPDKLDTTLATEMVGRGFNRFRLEIGPQVEFVNDNDDPLKLNMAAYRFAWQDNMIRGQLLPMMQALSKRGEPMVLYVSYDLRSSLTPEWLLHPEEYAEMALATLTHLKEKWQLEPKYWSVLNEPGNHRPGNPKLYAELTAATGKRIAEAGFKTRMSGPECVNILQIPRYMAALEATPGALDHFGQITYHLYHGGAERVEAREAVRAWATKLGVTAAQTEWMERSDLDVARHIYLCLTVANAVAWERYGWDLQVEPQEETFTRRSSAWYVAQFSQFIRPGATRIEIGSSDAEILPLAFSSTEGKPVLVMINAGLQGKRVRLAGLPGGRYISIHTAQDSLGLPTGEYTVKEGAPTSLGLAPRSVTTLGSEPYMSSRLTGQK